jgi:hypothetical protein
MKIGFIVECHEDGADHRVLKYLVSQLRPDITPIFNFGRSKRFILEDCRSMVELLFDIERCARVFVVWDLIPCNLEHQENGHPSCVRESAHLIGKLREQDKEKTIMVCIKHELEAWLLADGSALEALLRHPIHGVERIPDVKHPDRDPNPKKTLISLFSKKPRTLVYNDAVHALKIVEKANLSKLKRAPSFKLLKDKLEAL